MEHNLQLLASMGRLVALGRPLLVGTSRKTFLGRLAARPGQPPAPVDERLAGSLASAVWAATHGAAMVRVHDVAETVQAVRLLKPAAA
jgi:dihydropteroate synthase